MKKYLIVSTSYTLASLIVYTFISALVYSILDENIDNILKSYEDELGWGISVGLITEVYNIIFFTLNARNYLPRRGKGSYELVAKYVILDAKSIQEKNIIFFNLMLVQNR